MPVRRRVLTPVIALLLALGAAAVLALPGAARAESHEPLPPVRLVLVTAGLTWEDIDSSRTPALQCLAEGASLGAMNAASMTPRSTLRQGEESLRTGWRGLAADAPPSAGVPNPPVDLLAELPGGVVDLDASGTDAQADAAIARAGAELSTSEDSLVVLDLGAVPATGADDREQALSRLDARAAEALAAAGGGTTGGDCAAGLPRTLLVSAGYFPDDGGVPGTAPREVETGAADVPGRVMLQAVMDTGMPSLALTSGSTHQDGVVILTDIAPTILRSHGLEAPATVPGQPIAMVEADDPQRLALDRTMAADRLRDAEVPALLSWAGIGVLGVIVLLVPPLARRPRLAAIGRALAVCTPLAAPVGLAAGALPWWRAEHPTLALIGVIWLGCVPLAALVLLGPWRRSRLGLVGASAGIVLAGILLESATGSRLQMGSPLGAQAMIGGRYYGISNHLFGLVLGAATLLLLALLAAARTGTGRVLRVLVVGGAAIPVCVAPSMGADFGSMLALTPALGLLALLVSGIRLRPWHVLGLGALAAALVGAVALADWTRPPEQRTHLGRFVDSVLSGDLLQVIWRKLAENWAMTVGYPGLLVLTLAAIALSVLVLMPQRAGLARLAALDAQVPVAWSVRLAVVVGAWVGFLVNDTGAVLVAGALAMWLVLLPAALPDATAGMATEQVRGSRRG
ncbi:hypothetical protein [Brachybacterium hainanense]|uniref:Phosphoglyceromutase n=1 Tax=Brachybacterium hainanense TaxID=1541174 RepID=A0ABV6RGY1_9MICO